MSPQVPQRMAVRVSVRLRIFPRASWMVSALSLATGWLVLGNEVCIDLAISNGLQETAVLCVGIGELTNIGWFTRGQKTWLIFPMLAQSALANGNDRFRRRHT